MKLRKKKQKKKRVPKRIYNAFIYNKYCVFEITKRKQL